MLLYIDAPIFRDSTFKSNAHRKPCGVGLSQASFLKQNLGRIADLFTGRVIHGVVHRFLHLGFRGLSPPLRRNRQVPKPKQYPTQTLYSRLAFCGCLFLRIGDLVSRGQLPRYSSA
jgi:hypothetical protein